jgi:hypothetical protein
MNKWILALFLALAPLSVNAQDQTKWYLFSFPCGPYEPLLRLLADKKEYLLFTSVRQVFGADGKAYRGVTMLFTNQDTGNWTSIIRWSGDTACMLSSGTNFRPYDGIIPDIKNDL